MRHFRLVRGVLVGLAGALVGVVPDGVSAVGGRARCRATAFVPNSLSDSVSTIDVKSRTKHPNDILVGSGPVGVAVTPDGKAAFVANMRSGTVSTIDVKTRTKHRTDISVGAHPKGVAVTPDGKTAFVTNVNLVGSFDEFPGDSVSTIDVKTRKKHPTDITFGTGTTAVAVAPDGKTALFTHEEPRTVSTIDVKASTEHPTDIPVGAGPVGVAVTPDGKTAFVVNSSGSVSTIDVKTRAKDPTDIPVGTGPIGVAFTPCRR